MSESHSWGQVVGPISVRFQIVHLQHDKFCYVTRAVSPISTTVRLQSWIFSIYVLGKCYFHTKSYRNHTDIEPTPIPSITIFMSKTKNLEGKDTRERYIYPLLSLSLSPPPPPPPLPWSFPLNAISVSLMVLRKDRAIFHDADRAAAGCLALARPGIASLQRLWHGFTESTAIRSRRELWESTNSG